MENLVRSHQPSIAASGDSGWRWNSFTEDLSHLVLSRYRPLSSGSQAYLAAPWAAGGQPHRCFLQGEILFRQMVVSERGPPYGTVLLDDLTRRNQFV